MKKLLAIGGIIVVIFVLIIVLTKQGNKEKLQDNPYKTDKLDQSSIDLIGDKNYSNIILPDELMEKVNAGEAVTAYFFSPRCSYCLEMTPVMMPIAEKMDVDVKQFNVLEFDQEARPYGIEATPTMIHFENGEEVGRMVGGQSAENIQSFFEQINE